MTPPPPPGVADPPEWGGQERGTSVDPHPHPSGGGAQGAEAATSTAQVELDLPSPPGPCRGSQGSFSLPPPQRKGHSGWVGNEQGSHGALCRPCVMSTGPQHASHARGTGGVRHCYSRHHEGHPRVLGGSTVSAGAGGGCSSNWALCPSEGRCVRRHPRPGEGEGVQQGQEQQCCRAGARRSRSAATGGPQRRAHNPRRTSFRRAATHRVARGGIGQATGRL